MSDCNSFNEVQNLVAEEIQKWGVAKVQPLLAQVSTLKQNLDKFRWLTTDEYLPKRNTPKGKKVHPPKSIEAHDELASMAHKHKLLTMKLAIAEAEEKLAKILKKGG